MARNYSKYPAQQLAIYSLYGFRGEGNTPLEELAEIKEGVIAYVKTQPQRFKEDFRDAILSELERVSAEGEGELPLN